MLVRAGVAASAGVKYELDHFVPLAVGGDPRSEDNLWLQSWVGPWNATVKDRLERRLQIMTCETGEITLDAARRAVRTDWHAAYEQLVGPDTSAVPRGMESEGEEVVE